MNIALPFVHSVLLFALVYRVQQKHALFSAPLYWLTFLLKLIAAISVGLIYLFYYSVGDTWSYFAQATEMSALARNDLPAYFQWIVDFNDRSTVNHVFYLHDRSLLFVKLVSLLTLLTGNSYWICAAYFATLSFFASGFLFKQLVAHVSESSQAATLALFFFPSILFWSSGLMKETLALSAIYFLSAIFVKVAYKQMILKSEWLLVFISIFMGWSLKYYWMAIFLVVLITSLIVLRISEKKSMSSTKLMLTWLGLFVAIGFVATLAHPNFYLSRILEVLVSSYDQFVLVSGSKGIIKFDGLEPTLTSLLANSPWALFSGLYRPFVWEASSVLTFLASTENLFLMLLTILFLIHFRKNFTTFIFPLLTYAVVLCILLTISTPNLGTLSRYRIGFLPFLVFALAYRNPLMNFLSKRISFLNK